MIGGIHGTTLVSDKPHELMGQARPGSYCTHEAEGRNFSVAQEHERGLKDVLDAPRPEHWGQAEYLAWASDGETSERVVGH